MKFNKIVAVLVIIGLSQVEGIYIRKEPVRCLYTSQNEGVVPVECSPDQSCYAIVSLTHHNGTWSTHRYSLGCWEKLPSCQKDTCSIDVPNYIWVDHHFPRFCCCHGNMCNKDIETVPFEL